MADSASACSAPFAHFLDRSDHTPVRFKRFTGGAIPVASVLPSNHWNNLRFSGRFRTVSVLWQNFLVSNRSAHPDHGGYKAYFVIMCLAGVTAVGAAGEIAKGSQGFQPGARLAASNSPLALKPGKPCTSPRGGIDP